MHCCIDGVVLELHAPLNPTHPVVIKGKKAEAYIYIYIYIPIVSKMAI